jgi:hypothetical protein
LLSTSGGVVNAGEAVPLHSQSDHAGVADNIEVRAVKERAYVGVGGALAPASHKVQVAPSEPCLQAAADVVGASIAKFHRSLDTGPVQRMALGNWPDNNGPICPAYRWVTIVGSFATAKIWQQLVEGPSSGPLCCP